MPLISDSELVRIDLPEPGEFVEVKARMSRGDEVAIKQAAIAGAHLSAAMELDSLDPAAFMEAVEFATLERVIKRWSFTEPVTPENIRALDGESIDAIKAQLNVIYPEPRTDDDRKNSASSGAMPSSVEAESPLSLVESR